MASDRELLVEYEHWCLSEHYAGRVHYGFVTQVDAFLASRQPQGEPTTIHTPDGIPVECCQHGRPAGHPCPHCLGVNDGLAQPVACSCSHCEVERERDQPRGEPAVTIQCPACGSEFVRAGDGGKVLPAAPEPERFWRVDEHYRGGWFWYCVDREGAGAPLHGKKEGASIKIMSGESFCSLVRATRELAEADGRASGLPEWTGQRGTGGGR